MKPLLIFAHKAEAGEFFKRSEYKESGTPDLSLFESTKNYILVCGQGFEKARQNTEICLNLLHNKISNIINPGVAGALDPALLTGHIVMVRAVMTNFNTDINHSHIGLNKYGQVTCLTAAKEIVSQTESDLFRSIADIADMELWPIAYIAKNKNIKCDSVKIISDLADGQTGLKDIRDRVAFYSRKLYEAVQLL